MHTEEHKFDFTFIYAKQLMDYKKKRKEKKLQIITDVTI